MRRLCSGVFLLALTVFLSTLTSAQDFPKAEAFGGYSYLHVDTQGVSGSSLTNQCNIAFGGACPVTFQIHPGFNGWSIALQANLNRWFGVKAQIAGQHGNIITIKVNSTLPIPAISIPKQHVYDFLFGPVVSHRSEKYTAFVHGLVGAQHVGISENIAVGGIGGFSAATSETDFAFALGGGLDLRASHHFAIRVAQFDYELVNTSGKHQNDFRYSGGIVFGFGGK
jgi:hypothetical protein